MLHWLRALCCKLWRVLNKISFLSQTLVVFLLCLTLVFCRHYNSQNQSDNGYSPTLINTNQIPSYQQSRIDELYGKFRSYISSYQKSENFLAPKTQEDHEFNIMSKFASKLTIDHFRSLENSKTMSLLISRLDKRIGQRLFSGESVGENISDKKFKLVNGSLERKTYYDVAAFSMLIFGVLGLVTINQYRLDLDKLNISSSMKKVHFGSAAAGYLGFAIIAGLILSKDEPSDELISTARIALIAYGSYMIISLPEKLKSIDKSYREFLQWQNSEKIKKVFSRHEFSNLDELDIKLKENLTEFEYAEYRKASDDISIRKKYAPGMVYIALALGMVIGGAALNLAEEKRDDPKTLLCERLVGLINEILELENNSH